MMEFTSQEVWDDLYKLDYIDQRIFGCIVCCKGHMYIQVNHLHKCDYCGQTALILKSKVLINK